MNIKKKKKKKKKKKGKKERFYTTEILHVLLSLSFAKVSTPTDRENIRI